MYKCEKCNIFLTEDEVVLLYGETYGHEYQTAVDFFIPCGPVYEISEIDDETDGREYPSDKILAKELEHGQADHTGAWWSSAKRLYRKVLSVRIAPCPPYERSIK